MRRIWDKACGWNGIAEREEPRDKQKDFDTTDTNPPAPRLELGMAVIVAHAADPIT